MALVHVISVVSSLIMATDLELDVAELRRLASLAEREKIREKLTSWANELAKSSAPVVVPVREPL